MTLILIGLGRVLQLALVFITYRVFTSILDTEQVGLIFLIQSLAGFFGLIVTNPIGTYLSREVHLWEKSGLRRALSTFMLFGVVSSIIAAIVISIPLLTGLTAWKGYGHSQDLILAVTLMVAGQTLANSLIPLLNLLHRRVSFVALSLITQAAALGLAYLVNHPSLGTAQATHWMIASGSVQLAFGIFAYFWLLKGRPKPDEINIDVKQIRQFAGPIVITNLAVWTLMQGYRPLVESLGNLESLAIIGLGLGLATSIAVAFETLVHQLFLPKFYQSTHRFESLARSEGWNAFWRAVVPAYIGLTIVVIGLAEAFISVLATEHYVNAVRFLQIGAVAELFRMCGNVAVLVTQSERKTARAVLPYWTGAITAIAFAAFALHISNLEGVAYALVLGQGLAMIGLILQSYKASSGLSLKVPVVAISRFVAVPLALVFLLRSTIPLASLGISALVMGLLTLHYWWWLWRRETESIS